MKIINSTAVARLRAADTVFAHIIDTYGLPESWERAPGFETLCRIILEQQVSLESAHAAYLKLNERLPTFAPAEILALTDAEMRACYLSRQKTRYLRELSKAVIAGDLNFEKLSALTVAEVKTELTKIVGIGNWTAEVYLMFCLQSPDIFPAGDVAAVNTVKELTEAENKEDAVRIAEKWSPYRTTATYLLWHYYLCKRGRGVAY